MEHHMGGCGQTCWIEGAPKKPHRLRAKSSISAAQCWVRRAGVSCDVQGTSGSAHALPSMEPAMLRHIGSQGAGLACGSHSLKAQDNSRGLADKGSRAVGDTQEGGFSGGRMQASWLCPAWTRSAESPMYERTFHVKGFSALGCYAALYRVCLGCELIRTLRSSKEQESQLSCCCPRFALCMALRPGPRTLRERVERPASASEP